MALIRSGERCRDLAAHKERVARAAAGFAAAGLGRDDAVALVLRNDFAFFEAASAAGQVGVYSVPMNWHCTVDEAAYLFRDCGAKAVVIHADLYRKLKSAIPDGVLVYVVATSVEIAAAYGVADADCSVPEGCVDWDAWLMGFEPQPRRPIEPHGAIIYTGGTTGRPKGVRRTPPTKAQYLAAVGAAGFVYGLENALLASLEGRAPPRIVTVMTGPMYHSAPNTFGNLALRAQGDVILQPRFDPEELLHLIEQYRVTHLHMVPTMFVRLLKLSEAVRGKYDLSSLEHVVHAAAPCPPHVKRAMIDWWGPVIAEYYGSTETSAMTFCSSEDWLAHPGTVGRPLKDVGFKVFREDGSEAPQGEPGDVYCRLKTAADFTYHGDDGKRREAERDGLISVGDIGYFDADGFLYLCDRRHHMVISGGVNIYPAEIEAELLKVPGVADCAVFGIPDDEFGESLCAFVQPNAGVRLDEAAVREGLAGHVARYKVPKRIEFMDELPREDSGKIFKRKLRDPFWEKAGRSI